MAKHNVLISDAATAVVQSQVASGRFKDFSAAVQEAVWSTFVQGPNIFEEYGVTPAEIKRAVERSRREIERARKAGKLVPFKP